MCCVMWLDGGALSAIGGRDTSLFLFRALGKILYCKRESGERGEGEEGERGEGEEGKGEGWEEKASGRATVGPPQLPSHLREHERPRLLVDPEVLYYIHVHEQHDTTQHNDT